MRKLFPLLFALCMMAANAAYGQFSLNISVPRLNFLVLEAVPVTVSIINRSGADMTLGGPGQMSWLSFEMNDSKDRPLSPIDVSASTVVHIPAGGTIEQKVIVTDAYAPTDVGTYTLTARVLHPGSGQFYGSNRIRFVINDTKPMWEQTFGVPQGYEEAGRVRRYGLIVFRDDSSTAFYFRLMDDKSEQAIQTYRLGPVSLVIEPQITIDRTNRLQVFFLASPKIYAHCIIKPDGKLEKRTYYTETKMGRPQLAMENGGDPIVVGGEIYDPSAVAAKESAIAPRKASERPPGL